MMKKYSVLYHICRLQDKKCTTASVIFQSQKNLLFKVIFTFTVSMEGGTKLALNEKAKFRGFLCQVSCAPQIAVVVPSRREHNDMTAVYFMYKSRSGGAPACGFLRGARTM